ncbi:MAG TPA: amino acid permease [Gemmatimonadaceae bacterium]|nr:amino acid permease [Gemmatimonadaceae bacterium]
MNKPSRDDALVRQLGVGAITALVIGEVIAVGIFLTPAGMARSLGSPFWLLMVWLVMGGMALCGALCYGELAARFPEAGGGYVYLRRAYGPAVAFLYGWKCMLVMDPGITAALAVGLASYVGYGSHLSPAATKGLAIAAILVLALVSMLGVRLGARVAQWLTAFKVAALGMIILLALVLRRGDWANFTPFVDQRPGSVPLPGALAPALVGAFFAFGGWWEISKLAGDARDPARTVPRALALGIFIVTLVYVLTSLVFIYLVPLERVTSGETFAAQAGEALFGAAGGRIFSGLVIVAVLGSLLALLMALPRVYYAMARDGLFFRGVAKLHPKYGTPARAIALQAALASILVLLGTFNQIVSYFIFVTVFFLGLTVAALFILRRRDASSASFRTPGYPLTPAVFLILVVALLVLLAGNSPLQAALGTGIVALGAPLYYAVFRHHASVANAR